MVRKTRRMNFKSPETERKWLAYDAIHNPRFGAHPVDVDVRGRHVMGPMTEQQRLRAEMDGRTRKSLAHAHHHHDGHHGGRCGPYCRAGNMGHRHRGTRSHRTLG